MTIKERKIPKGKILNPIFNGDWELADKTEKFVKDLEVDDKLKDFQKNMNKNVMPDFFTRVTMMGLGESDRDNLDILSTFNTIIMSTAVFLYTNGYFDNIKKND